MIIVLLNLNFSNFVMTRNKKMTSFSPPPSVRCDRTLRESNVLDVCQFTRDNMDNLSSRHLGGVDEYHSLSTPPPARSVAHGLIQQHDNTRPILAPTTHDQFHLPHARSVAFLARHRELLSFFLLLIETGRLWNEYILKGTPISGVQIVLIKLARCLGTLEKQTGRFKS